MKIVPYLFAIFGILVLIFAIHFDSQYNVRTYKPLNYFGTVKNKFLDPKEKMEQRVTLSDGITYNLRNDIFDKISIGDTLYKRAGSMKHYYIKYGDTIIFYQQSRGVDIK